MIAKLNPEAAAFRDTLDNLNRFMSREDLPHEMRRRLREYFHQSKHLRLAQTQRALLSDMPPSLMLEVSWETNKGWLKKTWFLKDAPAAFLTEMAISLTAMVYAPGDMPKLGYMYIVNRGVAVYRARLVTKGRVFGEDMILESPHLRSTAQAKCMNYLEVYYISRSTLLAVAKRYPRTLSAIRRAAFLLALRREIILVAKWRLGCNPNDSLSELKKAASGGRVSPLLEPKEVATRTDPTSWTQARIAFKSSQIFSKKTGPVGLFAMLDQRDGPDKGGEEVLDAEDPNELVGAQLGGMGGSSGGASAGGSISHLATAISAQLEKVTEAHRKEIMQLRGQLMREISIEREARAVAQQQLLELTAQTAARVEEIYSGRKLKRQRTPSSATLLDAEDRFQDGTAEPVRERPSNTRSRQRHTGTAGVAATAGPAQGILEGLYRSIQPATASAGANPRDAHLAA